MDKSMVSIYMQQVEKIPLLSVQEEKVLLEKAANGDKKAKDKIVTSNLRYVVKMANQFVGRGVDFEDLICEGNQALIRAVEKMDLSKNVRFITYATFWIRQYMKAAVYASGRSVVIPQNRPQELKKSKWVCVSLDKPLTEDDGGTLGDFLKDENASAENDLLNKEFSNDLHSALNLLKPKERFVIIKHFGLDNKEPMSLREIGDWLNLSREGIRQIEKRAFEKLSNNENMAIWGGAAA